MQTGRRFCENETAGPLILTKSSGHNDRSIMHIRRNQMVYRVFVEKRKELAHEASSLFSDARNLLGIGNLEDVRIINRYDAENIDKPLFDYAVKTVFSEPQVDIVYGEDELALGKAHVFAVEYLPGQFDQRADSAAQCIQIISQKERPLVRSAKVYALYGNLTDDEISAPNAGVLVIPPHMDPMESRVFSLNTL